jgi:hypothetical protein
VDPKSGGKSASDISFITVVGDGLPEPLVLGPLARARITAADISAGPGVIVHGIDSIMSPPMDLFKGNGVDLRMPANIQDALTRATGKAPLPSSNAYGH